MIINILKKNIIVSSLNYSQNTDPEIWWDECSPNIGMSPYTFLVNRETATNYLNIWNQFEKMESHFQINELYQFFQLLFFSNLSIYY